MKGSIKSIFNNIVIEAIIIIMLSHRCALTRSAAIGLRESGVLTSVPEHGGTVIGPPSPPILCFNISRQLHI